jgi:hypothetical protein
MDLQYMFAGMQYASTHGLLSLCLCSTPSCGKLNRAGGLLAITPCGSLVREVMWQAGNRHSSHELVFCPRYSHNEERPPGGGLPGNYMASFFKLSPRLDPHPEVFHANF